MAGGFDFLPQSPSRGHGGLISPDSGAGELDGRGEEVEEGFGGADALAAGVI